MEAVLEKYKESFRKIKVSNRRGKKAPHKAVLLLAIMSLIEDGVQTTRFIEYSEPLKKKFKSIWSEYIGVSDTFNPEIAMPFWYLKNDSDIWRLVPKDNTPETIQGIIHTSLSTSLKSNQKYVKYAEIPEPLFNLMQNKWYRAILAEVLFETYIFV